MAQTFRFFCALLLLGAFCGLIKTDGSSGSLTPAPDGGDATPPPIPDGGDATPAPTPDGGDATPPPIPDGGDATPAPTPDGGDATPAPTPDGGDATPPPTPDGGDATPPPTPDGGDATPAPTPDGGDATPPPTPDGGDATPAPTPDGGDATPAPTPDGGDATPPPTPDGGDATPAPTPDGGDVTPAPTPDGGDATPAPTPDGGDATPAPTPDGGDVTPVPTPDGGDVTPAPTPDGGDATPTPTPDGGDATPAPTPDSTATPVSGATGGTPQQTAAPPDACSSSPCGPGSTCESRAGGAFECLCLPGAYYSQITCVIAKVFPGELTFEDIPFSEGLTDKTSALFQQTSQLVTGRIDQAFNGIDDYLNSTVLEFLSAPTERLSFRNQQTTASMHIIFNLDATIDESAVFDVIENCTECNATAVPRSLCNAQPCDLTSTTCEAGNGNFTCSCKNNYINSDFSERMCIACPSGQQAVNDRCTDCPFGYSGFNCAEHWKLALVIVAAVLGAVLLITLIVLVTVVVRSKKRSKASSTAAIGKPYTSHSPANSPLVNGSKGAPAMTGMPRIPRATAQNGAGFNLEMTPSNSRQNLISSGGNSRHYDDVLAHGQNRPQSNPYTSNRGQDNPYNKYDGR